MYKRQDVHRLAGGLGSGDPGLVAHQLIEIGPDLRLHIGGNIGIFLQIDVYKRQGLRTLVHLILLPLVVGITYEFNRWVGRHVQDSKLAQFLTAPGLWMQNFTTNEPDDSMIECAIRSLELVLPSEKGKDAW